MSGSVTGQWSGFVGWIRTLDTTRLKRISVVTYFGFYALLLFDVHRAVNEVIRALPEVIQPPLLDPVWVVMDLPRSVAMGVSSLVVATLVVGILVARSALTTLGERRPGPTADRTARATTEPTRPDQDEWTGGTGGQVASYWVQDSTRIRDGGPSALDDDRNNVHGVRSEVSTDHPRHVPEPEPEPVPAGEAHERAEPVPAGEVQERAEPVPAGEAHEPAEREPGGADEESWPEGWVSGAELSASSQD